MSGGGGIRFGYPLSETSSMNLGFTIDSTNINLSGASTVTVTDSTTWCYVQLPERTLQHLQLHPEVRLYQYLANFQCGLASEFL